MKVNTPIEAIDLLLRSRRIMWDLKFHQMHPDTAGGLSIVIREWLHIPQSLEFRAFVYENKLNGISQYFSQVYFEELQAPGILDALQAEMMAFWKLISPHFDYIQNLPDPLHQERLGKTPIVKYVIDFALVVPDVSPGWLGNPHRRWIVLEVNPFNISTGSCLFDWENEKDCDILFGTSPFEFRVLKAPIAHTQRNKVAPEWRTRLFPSH